MDRLFVGVRKLAQHMGVSEKTIYRMLNDNQIPFAVKIGGQWRFRADSVEKWITAQMEGGRSEGIINYRITVADALGNGSVLYRIHGGNRDEALDELFSTLPRTGAFNAKNCKFSILAREALAPSSLAGIACMAPSSDHPVYLERSLIILAFLEEPVNFKALDGEPAMAIFLILAANASEQAILETRLRRLLMEADFVAEIKKQPARKELSQYILEYETGLLQPPKKSEEKPPAGREASTPSPLLS
ncbi:MAG: helix-turn-helix domain-containing protein [Desulfobulbaceae bacterium]